MKRRKDTCNPRVRLHANGRATLSGFHYRDLKSVLTAAALWTYQEMKREDAERAARGHLDGCNCTDCATYQKTRLAFLDMAKASLDRAISATHGPPRAPTVEERRAQVQESIRLRKLIAEVLAQRGAAQAVES